MMVTCTVRTQEAASQTVSPIIVDMKPRTELQLWRIRGHLAIS